MISPFGSRGANRSATLSAGTETPLLRPLKLQQPNHQNASEYDVSCFSLTHMSVLTLSADDVGVEQAPTASTTQQIAIANRQLIAEGRLLIDATTPNSAYVPGNTQREPLIIEDDSDDESDDEVEVGVASSDLLASIGDQDASENGLATQDTASTPSSLFGPS
ncbi:hypothetical protein V502_04323, partial [Pseudogymnoascus sp. VKM F-4520 (FW-2644)]